MMVSLLQNDKDSDLPDYYICLKIDYNFILKYKSAGFSI